MGVRVTKITGSRSDNWIYWHFDYKFSLNHTYHSAIADLHNLQFPGTHVLVFSLTSRLLATGLNTETSTSYHYEVFLPFLVQSPWNLGTQIKTLLDCLLSSQSQSYVTTGGSVGQSVLE
jgi:hypothetical protein